jgi:hypothetical protein
MFVVASLLTALPGEQQHDIVERPPTAYIIVPVVAANATAQMVTSAY